MNYCDELLAFVEKTITFQDVCSSDISIFAFQDVFSIFQEHYQESLKDPQLHRQIKEMIRVEKTVHLMLKKSQIQDISTYLKLLGEEEEIYETLLLLTWKHGNDIHDQYSKDYLALFHFLRPFLELLLHVNCDFKTLSCLTRETKIELIQKTSEKLRSVLKCLNVEISESDLLDELPRLREVKTQIQVILGQNMNAESGRMYYGLGLQFCLALLVKNLEAKNDEFSKMGLLVFLYSEKFKEFGGVLEKVGGQMDLRVWETPLSLTSVDEIFIRDQFQEASLEMLDGILTLLRIRKHDAKSLFLKPRGERGFFICEMMKLLEENKETLTSTTYPLGKLSLKFFDVVVCNALEIAEDLIGTISKETIKFTHIIQALFSQLKKLLEVTGIKLLTRYKLYSLITKIAKNEVETMIPALENHFYLSEKRLKDLINTMELVDQPEILSLNLRFSANLLKSQVGPNTGTLPTIYININDWVVIFKAFTESNSLNGPSENAKHIGLFLNELLDCGLKKLESDRNVIDKFYDRLPKFLIEKVGLESRWDLCSFNKHFWSHFLKYNSYLNHNASQWVQKLFEIESEMAAKNQIEFKLIPTQRGPLESPFLNIWSTLVKDVETAIFKTPSQISENFWEMTRLKVRKLVYFALPTLCWYIKTLTPGEVKNNAYGFTKCCELLEVVSRIYFCPISMLLLNLDERAIFSNQIKGIISQKNTGCGRLCQIFHQSIYDKWTECSKKGLVGDVLKEELELIMRDRKKYEKFNMEFASRYYLSTNYFCALNLYWTVIQMKTLEKVFKDTLSDKALSYKLKFEDLITNLKNNSKSVGDIIVKAMKFSNKEFVSDFIDVTEVLGLLLSKDKAGIKLFAKMIGHAFEDSLEKCEGILRLANSAGKINQDAERAVFQRLFCGENTFVTICKRLLIEEGTMQDEVLQIASFIRLWSRNFKLDSKRFEELKKEFKEVNPNKSFEDFIDDCYSKWIDLIGLMLSSKRRSKEYDEILESIAQLMERFYFYQIEKCKEPKLDELEASIVKSKKELVEAHDEEKRKDLESLIKKEEGEFKSRSQSFQSLMKLAIFYDFKGLSRIERRRVNEAREEFVLGVYKSLCRFCEGLRKEEEEDKLYWEMINEESAKKLEFENDVERIAYLRNNLELVLRFSELLNDKDTPSPKIFTRHLYQSSLAIFKRLLLTEKRTLKIQENVEYLISHLTKIFLTFYACEFSRNRFGSKDLEEIVVWVNLALDAMIHFEFTYSCEGLLGMLNIGLYYDPSFMMNLLFVESNSPLKRVLSQNFCGQKARGCLLKLIDDSLGKSFSAETKIEVEVKKILLKNGEGMNLNLMKGNVLISNQEPETVVNVLENNFNIFKNEKDSDEINISFNLKKELQKKVVLTMKDQNLKTILDFLVKTYLEAYLDNLCSVFKRTDEKVQIKRDSEMLSVISALVMKYPHALVYAVFEIIDVSQVVEKFRERIPFLKNEELKSMTFLEIIKKIQVLIFNPDSAISFLKSVISCSGVTLAIDKSSVIFDISYFIIDNILETMINIDCKDEGYLDIWQNLHSNIALLTLILEQVKVIRQIGIKNRFLLKLGSLNGKVLAQQIHLLPDIYKELHSWGNIVQLWSEYIEKYKEISIEEENIPNEIEEAFKQNVKAEIQLGEGLGKSQTWRWKDEGQNYLIGEILVRSNSDKEFNKSILSFLTHFNNRDGSQIRSDNYSAYLEAVKCDKNNKTDNYSIISRFLDFKNLTFFQVMTSDEKEAGDKFYEIISKKFNQPEAMVTFDKDQNQDETKPKEEMKIQNVADIVVQKDQEAEKNQALKYFYHPALDTPGRFQELESAVLLRLKVLKERISVLIAFTDPLQQNQKDLNEEVEKEIKDFDLFERNLLFCLNKDFNLIEPLKYPNNIEEIQETRNWIRNNLEKYIEILKSEKRGEAKNDLKNGPCSSDPRMFVSLSKGLPIETEAVPTEKKDSLPAPADTSKATHALPRLKIEDPTWELLMKFFYLDYEDNLIKGQKDYIFEIFEEFCCQSKELETKLFNYCFSFLYGLNNHTTSLDIFHKSAGLLSNLKKYEIVAMNMLKFFEYYMTGNDGILSRPWSLENEKRDLCSFCDFVIGLKKSCLCENALLKETLDNILINILEKIKNFKVIKSEIPPPSEEKNDSLKYESVEALFEIKDFEEILQRKKYSIFLHNFKGIAGIIEEQVDKLVPELEKINKDLKLKLKEIPENEAALPICDTIQVYNVQSALMTIQRYLGFVSSMVGNWFLSQKSYPDDSIEMSCLKSFKKRILEEKIIEDFMLHLFEVCWHLSHQKIPKVPQITKIVTIILKICVSFESLLFVNQNVENSKNIEKDTNMSIFDFPTLCKISSFDFADKKKLPELTSSFSYLRDSREFNFDILLTNICKKFPDIFSKIAVENVITNKLTDDVFILLKKLPWILDFQYKTQFLQSAISARLRGQNIPIDTRKITVDRANLIRSTLEQLTTSTSKELLQKISIAFENEGGVDAGGLRREWMSLVLKELFDPSFGLFSFSENKTGIQPSQTAPIIPHYKTYLELAGIMLAKVIQEGHVVSVNFTRPFLRHILKRSITLNDMDDIDEALAKNIKWIIENNVEGLELSFSYEVEILGERVTRELIKDGNETILTDENKLEFVKRICQMKMKEEMNEGLEAFLKGFHSIIPADLLTSFSTTELQILISGTPTVNLEEIKENAVYNGYTKDCQVILWLWEILADFSPKEWSALLFFITGGTNLPFGVLKTKPIKFRKYWRADSLPIAHTCYSEIEIPEYKSKEELKQKLFVAIFEGQVGFGMA